MTRKERIQLKISDDDDDDDIVAYLTLPDRPEGLAVVKRTLRLRDLIEDYIGPDLYFDFDEDNVLIGVEILD